MTLDSTPGSVIFPTKACHNCRRRRRRCDRSQPYCYRCSRDGEECLGYGRILRWVDSAPPTASQSRPPFPKHGSPGDSHGTAGVPMSWSGNLNQVILISPSLVDPLLNDLDCNSRYYIHHCMLSSSHAAFILHFFSNYCSTQVLIPMFAEFQFPPSSVVI